MKSYTIEEIYTCINVNYKPFDGDIPGLCHIEEMSFIDGGIAPSLAVDVHLRKLYFEQARGILFTWCFDNGHDPIDAINNLIRRYLIGNDPRPVRYWCVDIMQDFILELIYSLQPGSLYGFGMSRFDIEAYRRYYTSTSNK